MFKKSLSKTELALFCYQFSLILRSGIPILEAVDVLQEETTDPQLSAVVKSMVTDIQEGVSIHQSLSKQEIFPSYFLGMVEIAEKTGNLDRELERLSYYYENQERMAQKIKNAVIYPVILLVMMFMIIVFLITKVLPMFNGVLESLGGEVPSSTRKIIQFGMTINNNLPAILIALAVLIVAAVIYLNSPGGKKNLYKMGFKLPWTGSLARKMIAANFSQGMGMLVKGGIGIDQSMELIQSYFDNDYVVDKLKIATSEIEQGDSVVTALEKTQVFPPLFIRLFKAGYQSGEMENTMEKISGIYQLEVEKGLQKVISSIEPVLVIILSAVVGITLLGVMVPLINIISSIG